MRTLFIDTETTGLYPHRDRVTLFQYMWEGDKTATLIQKPNYSDIHALLDSADRIIGHNLSFDFGMLGYIPKHYKKFDDTLYLSRICDFKEREHSLDAVVKRTFGYDLYRNLDKKKLQRTDWSQDELTEEQIKYASLDVEVLPTIYARFQYAIDNPIYKFDKRSIIAGLRVQAHGLPVLHDEVRDEAHNVKSELERVLALLPFNPNSPKQVTSHFGISSSGDRVMAGLEADGDNLAKLTRTARGQAKYHNFLSKLNENVRYRGTLQPAARSGRFTSSKENIQNLPRDTKKFIGVDPGRVIISADFAQLELRTIAAITGDKTMVELFINGEDLHNFAAKELFGPDFTKEQRQIAKVFNFSTLYGAGAGTIGLILLTQTGIKLPEDEINRLKRKWLNTFSGIAQWQRQGSTRHEMGIAHRTPHGRRYVSERFTDHLSIENQGAGAEVARIALHYIDDNLPVSCKLINFIHDSYAAECENAPALYKEAAKVIHEGMVYAWERAPFDKHGIPMPVEVGVAHNLKDADTLSNCLYIYEGK